MATSEEIIKAIEGMSVLELSALVKALEDKFGVQASIPMVAAGAVASAGGAGQAEAEEKSVFTIMLTDAGSNKIAVIKEVRAVTNLSLKEAKDLVDSVPKPVKESVPKEEAQEIKKKIEAAGGKVELK